MGNKSGTMSKAKPVTSAREARAMERMGSMMNRKAARPALAVAKEKARLKKKPQA